MKDVEGKTAFITGAASGIGFGMAESFAEAILRLRDPDRRHTKGLAGRHAVERAVILCDSQKLETSDFILQHGNTGQRSATGVDSYNLEDLEKWAIRKVLTKHAGNISRAADELGLTRATCFMPGLRARRGRCSHLPGF